MAIGIICPKVTKESKSIGNEGYLVSKGLIPLPKSERAKFEKDGKTLAKFDENLLKK